MLLLPITPRSMPIFNIEVALNSSLANKKHDQLLQVYIDILQI